MQGRFPIWGQRADKGQLVSDTKWFDLLMCLWRESLSRLSRTGLRSQLPVIKQGRCQLLMASVWRDHNGPAWAKGVDTAIKISFPPLIAVSLSSHTMRTLVHRLPLLFSPGLVRVWSSLSRDWVGPFVPLLLWSDQFWPLGVTGHRSLSWVLCVSEPSEFVGKVWSGLHRSHSLDEVSFQFF